MADEWWTKAYKGGPMVPLPGFPRPLYPPDAAKQGKRPSSDGPDVVAYKRTVSRAGRWPWQPFDDSYSNRFSHGSSSNVGESGVAGIQRQQKIDDTGWIGKPTFNTLRSIRVPEGLPHAGEMAMDAYSAELLRQAWELFGGQEPADEQGAEDRVRDAIVDFAELGLANPGGWDYQMVRPLDVSVDPAGRVTSDCSMSAIQAFNYAAARTGLAVPDPAKQGYSGYGNTDYFEVEHPRVTSGKYLVGDLAHYGDDGGSNHVTVCIREGDASSADWWSFGSEPPSRRKLYYRSDYLWTVRPPLT